MNMRMFAVSAACILTIAGCSALPEPEIATPGPGPILSKRAPMPPPGSGPGLTVPKPGLDGRYATINSGIAGGEALWHVRAAINVAALSCRNTPSIAPGYNRFLADRKAQLTSAYAKEDGRLRPQGASALDQHATRIYNFFAQPAPQEAFCRAAANELTAISAVPGAQLEAQAGESVARLEAPFTDFYRAYNKYLSDLAIWRAANPNAAFADSADGRFGLQGLMPDPGPASGAWSVEIGSFATRAAAEAARDRASGRDPAFAALTPRYDSVDGGQLRVRLGAETDRTAALALCAAAAANGYDCVQAE